MRNVLTAIMAATWAILLLGGAFRPQGYSPDSPPRADVGYPAPELTAVDADGREVRLSDLRGRAVFLNFWASWCAPCRMEMPEIQRLQEELPPGTAILAVNMTVQESSPESPFQFMKEQGYTFPVALDPTGQSGEEFRAVSLPTSLFISPDGMVNARISGPLSQRAMVDYLAAAAGAKAVEPGHGGLLDQPWLRQLSPGAYLPEAIALGPAVLTTRALAWLVGALLAYLLAGLWSRRAGLDVHAAQDLVLNLVIGGILGAKLIYVVLDPAAYLNSPSLLLAFPYGSMALPGALLGGIALGAWGLRRQANRLALLDQLLPALTLGAALAASGSPEPSSWAFALLLLLAGGFAAWVRLRTLPPGQGAAASLIGLALAVVLADLTRPAPAMGGVTTLQLVAALLGTAAWYWQGCAQSGGGPQVS